MPFLKKVKPPHECRLPDATALNRRARYKHLPGTEWQCGRCKQVWVIAPFGLSQHWTKQVEEPDA